MQKITKDMLIGDLLRMDSDVSYVLLKAGLHCLGCPGSQMESLEDAGMVHGIDVDELVEEINKFLENKENQE